MKKLSLVATALLVTMMCGGLSSTALAADSMTRQQTIAGAADRVAGLKENYLKGHLKQDSGALVGVGWNDGNDVSKPSEANKKFAQQNAMATLALLKHFKASGVPESEHWGLNEVWPILKNEIVATGGGSTSVKSDDKVTSGYRYAADQFIFLEFIGESYLITENADMGLYIQGVYSGISVFKANNSYYGIGAGDWWSKIFGLYKSEDTLLDYPLVSNSLWAAAGLCTFAMAVEGTMDDYEGVLSKPAVVMAEDSMAFAAGYGYNRTVGLFGVDRVDGMTNASAAQQALALLAYARLAQRTGKVVYLARADALLNQMMLYFWDDGYGGLYSSYDFVTQSNPNVKDAYSNGLFAYALSQLAKATGVESFDFRGFVLGQDQNRYYEILVDTVNAADNLMWSDSINVDGYLEWVQRDGTVFEENDPEIFGYGPNSRMASSNMLLLYALAEIEFVNQPFVVKYQTYMIWTIGVAAVVIFIIVLVVKRASGGTKLSKTVRGLLGD